jgi:hypothetical protein
MNDTAARNATEIGRLVTLQLKSHNQAHHIAIEITQPGTRRTNWNEHRQARPQAKNVSETCLGRFSVGFVSDLPGVARIYQRPASPWDCSALALLPGQGCINPLAAFASRGGGSLEGRLSQQCQTENKQTKIGNDEQHLGHETVRTVTDKIEKSKHLCYISAPRRRHGSCSLPRFLNPTRWIDKAIARNCSPCPGGCFLSVWLGLLNQPWCLRRFSGPSPCRLRRAPLV